MRVIGCLSEAIQTEAVIIESVVVLLTDAKVSTMAWRVQWVEDWCVTVATCVVVDVKDKEASACVCVELVVILPAI